MNKINYSIIIPHHNTPDLLKRLVDSIPQREDVEVIIVDDNSDADKKARIERSDITTFYIEKEDSRGAGKARNLGLDNARGKWILFSDSDDFFSSELNSMMDKYKDASADVVVFPIRVVDSDTLQEGNLRNGNFNQLIFDKNKSNKEKLLETAALWSKFINRDLIEQNHIRCEEIRWANDQMFSALVAINAKDIICDTENKIYNLTYRTGSLTRNESRETFECRLNAELRFYQLLNKHGIKIHRKTYCGFTRHAAHYGFACFFKTNKLLRAAKVQPYNDNFSQNLNVQFLMSFMYTFYCKLIRKS